MNRRLPFTGRSAQGTALHWLRIGFALSKHDLAAAMGIPCGRLAVLEAGLSELSASELEAIAHAFEISPTELRIELSRGPWPATADPLNEVGRITQRLREISAERRLLWARSEPVALCAISRLDDERERLLGRLWRIDERTARNWSL